MLILVRRKLEAILFYNIMFNWNLICRFMYQIHCSKYPRKILILNWILSCLTKLLKIFQLSKMLKKKILVFNIIFNIENTSQHGSTCGDSSTISTKFLTKKISEKKLNFHENQIFGLNFDYCDYSQIIRIIFRIFANFLQAFLAYCGVQHCEMKKKNLIPITCQ